MKFRIIASAIVLLILAAALALRAHHHSGDLDENGNGTQSGDVQQN
jgi:hypothetical protein